MKYDNALQRIAGELSKGDRYLAEELRNEMHVAILGMEEGRDRGYYIRAAKIRALQYIRSKAREEGDATHKEFHG